MFYSGCPRIDSADTGQRFSEIINEGVFLSWINYVLILYIFSFQAFFRLTTSFSKNHKKMQYEYETMHHILVSFEKM